MCHARLISLFSAYWPCVPVELRQTSCVVILQAQGTSPLTLDPATQLTEQ